MGISEEVEKLINIYGMDALEKEIKKRKNASKPPKGKIRDIRALEVYRLMYLNEINKISAMEQVADNNGRNVRTITNQCHSFDKEAKQYRDTLFQYYYNTKIRSGDYGLIVQLTKEMKWQYKHLSSDFIEAMIYKYLDEMEENYI